MIAGDIPAVSPNMAAYLIFVVNRIFSLLLLFHCNSLRALSGELTIGMGQSRANTTLKDKARFYLRVIPTRSV